MSSNETVAKAMREYGQATRGDWSDIDGRTVRDVMDSFASAVTGGPEADWDIDRWRNALGTCPAGRGHWGGDWYGYCDDDCKTETSAQ